MALFFQPKTMIITGIEHILSLRFPHGIKWVTESRYEIEIKKRMKFFLLKVIQILTISNIFLIECYGVLYKCFNHHQHKIKCHNSVSSLLHVYHSGCLNYIKKYSLKLKFMILTGLICENKLNLTET